MDYNPQGEKKDLFRLLLVAGLIAGLIFAVRGIFSTLPGGERGEGPVLTAAQETLPAAMTATAGFFPSPTWSAPEASPHPSQPSSPSPAPVAVPQPPGRLAFVAVQDRYPALYVVNADGSGLAQLSDEMGFLSAPAWSPDGRRLVFSAIQDVNVEVGEADLYMVNADGSGFANLTRSPAGELSPDWSPGGGSAQQIVFVSTQTGKEELFVMSADGTGARQLTNDQHTFARDPRWSPGSSSSPGGGSAQQIAFTCANDLEPFVCLIRADGTGLTRLVPGAFARWSPDGRRLAFLGAGNSGSRDIFLINEDGSGLANLTDSPIDESGFTWAPDGAWIAFGAGQGEAAGLYRVCIACGAEAQAVQALAEPGKRCSDPVWSLDGRAMACFMDGVLSLINADGTGLTRLVEGALPKSYAWGPDP